jgi:hypothetical protein
MKKLGILFIGLTALTAVSCSSSDDAVEGEEMKVEAVTYTLDQENSSIKWKGQMSPEYFHTGTVDFSEGSITMEGSELTSGSFTVDMTTIKNTDLEAPKSDYLVGHLTGTMVDEAHPQELFFNTPKFPNVKVTVDGYTDSNMDLTISILGKEVKQSVDALLMNDSNEASIKGAFSIDLTSVGIMGLQVNPEDGSQISPMIEFEVIIALTK